VWGLYYQYSNEWTDLEKHSSFRRVSLCNRTHPGSSAGCVVDACITCYTMDIILARRRDVCVRNGVVAADQRLLHTTGRHFVQKVNIKTHICIMYFSLFLFQHIYKSLYFVSVQNIRCELLTKRMTFSCELGHVKFCFFVQIQYNKIRYVMLLVYVYLSRIMYPWTRAHTGTRSSPRGQGTCHHSDKLSQHIHRYLQHWSTLCCHS